LQALINREVERNFTTEIYSSQPKNISTARSAIFAANLQQSIGLSARARHLTSRKSQTIIVEPVWTIRFVCQRYCRRKW